MMSDFHPSYNILLESVVLEYQNNVTGISILQMAIQILFHLWAYILFAPTLFLL
jgi:hypothetical protein